MPGNAWHLFFVKDYYSIIGVKRFASTAEVRRAYRKLVQQYHPDVNPNPSAATIIRAVNEAYEVLGDEQKKAAYDRLLLNPGQGHQTAVPVQKRHRDPYFNRRGYRPVYKRPGQYELVLQYFHYVKKVCVSGLAVCLILAVDYSLPKKHVRVPIEIERSDRYDYLVTPRERFAVFWEELYPFRENAEAELVKSRLLGKIIKIRSVDGAHSITGLATIYGTFKFVPVIVFITAMICLFMPGNEEFRFGLCVLTAFTLFFTLFLMYI